MHSSLSSTLCFLGACLLLLAPGGMPPAAAQTRIDPARAADAVPTSDLIRSADDFAASMTSAASAGLDEENAFAPVTPGDSDIGQQLILKREEKKQPFALYADSSMFWTDNAANVRSGEIDDWFFVGGVTASWQDRLHSRFYGDIFASQHFYRYNELDVLDYESGNLGVGVLVLMPELANTIWHLHYAYQRITQGLGDAAIYQTHNLRGGMQKTFLIDRLNSVNVGMIASLALDADPDILQRHEYTLQAGYKFKIMRDLFFSLNYRFGYFDYFNLASREDFYHNMGASLNWRPRKFLELSASYNYAVNDSNLDFFDYEGQLAGPAMSLKFKF